MLMILPIASHTVMVVNCSPLRLAKCCHEERIGKKNHSATAEDGYTMYQATKLKALVQWESISSLEFHHIMEMYDM